MEPVCQSCDKKLGKSNEIREVVAPELMSLIFSAELASEELGIRIELIDINQLSMVQRTKERLNGKPIPRVSIGDDLITGSPTKDEIIEFHNRVCKNTRESYSMV